MVGRGRRSVVGRGRGRGRDVVVGGKGRAVRVDERLGVAEVGVLAHHVLGRGR